MCFREIIFAGINRYLIIFLNRLLNELHRAVFKLLVMEENYAHWLVFLHNEVGELCQILLLLSWNFLIA